MGTSSRSPLLGYNHNVRYRGRVFHVQTEDSGPANPHLFTHLFYEGIILATKKCDYDGAADEDHVRGLMQGQHKQILKDLKQGAFDDKLAAFFSHRGEPFAAEETVAINVPALPAEAAPLVPPPAPAPAPVEPAAPPAWEQPTASPPVLDLDAIRTPLPDQGPVAAPPVDPAPPRVPHAVPSPGAHSFRRPTRELASPFAPTRPGAVPAHPVAPVVVQRRVVVGGAHPTPVPAQPMPPVRRVRRPASATPYVVREGSHPNLVAARQSTTPPPAQPTAAPNGAGTPRVAAAPPAPSRPAAGPADQSLDDVILAYLSQGENKG